MCLRVARSALAKDLDGEDLGLLGDSICLGRDGARNVRSVSDIVGRVVIDGVGDELRAALEFL